MLKVSALLLAIAVTSARCKRIREFNADHTEERALQLAETEQISDSQSQNVNGGAESGAEASNNKENDQREWATHEWSSGQKERIGFQRELVDKVNDQASDDDHDYHHYYYQQLAEAKQISGPQLGDANGSVESGAEASKGEELVDKATDQANDYDYEYHDYTDADEKTIAHDPKLVQEADEETIARDPKLVKQLLTTLNSQLDPKLFKVRKIAGNSVRVTQVPAKASSLDQHDCFLLICADRFHVRKWCGNGASAFEKLHAALHIRRLSSRKGASFLVDAEPQGKPSNSFWELLGDKRPDIL